MANKSSENEGKNLDDLWDLFRKRNSDHLFRQWQTGSGKRIKMLEDQG